MSELVAAVVLMFCAGAILLLLEEAEDLLCWWLTRRKRRLKKVPSAAVTRSTIVLGVALLLGCAPVIPPPQPQPARPRVIRQKPYPRTVAEGKAPEIAKRRVLR